MSDRPSFAFDPGVQLERTALAWERTGIAVVAAGLLFVAHVPRHLMAALVPLGAGFVIYGIALLAWSARHYEDLHGRLPEGASVVHIGSVRVVGMTTAVFAASALVLAVLSL